MTLIASILFLTALAASVLVIAGTLADAMPRITQVVEAEFGPAIQTERRINFGTVKQRQVGGRLRSHESSPERAGRRRFKRCARRYLNEARWL